MALFTAETIPMISSLAKATSLALERNQLVIQALNIMANSCYSMIKSKKFFNYSTQLYCARAMTGAIVVYDHVDSLGKEKSL